MTTARFKYLLASILGVAALFVALSPAAHAQIPADDPEGGVSTSRCNQTLLTFPAWYNGLVNSECEIKSPTEAGGIAPFIWKIVLNIVEMILRAAGYAAVAFIIYGGYKYMISAGSPDGMVSARKTIMNAVIGLVISVAAVAIVRTVSSGLGVG